MINCPKCGNRPGLQGEKRKSGLLPYIAVVSIIVLVVIGYVALVLIPPLSQQAAPLPEVSIAPTAVAGGLNPQSSIPALTATKQADGKITISVMGGTGLSDVSSFEVRMNNAVIPASLAPNAGASMIITGTKGTDHLIVVARNKNGSETVVLVKDL